MIATSEPDPLVKSILLNLKLPIPFYKYIYLIVYKYLPIPVAARSKGWVYSHSIAGTAGSNSAGGQGRLSVVSVVCCQVEVFATGWSLVQRSPTECDVSVCDLET